MHRINVGKHALPTHFIFQPTSPYDAFNVRINSPSPFKFPHSKFRNIVFSSTEKAQTFSRGKGGHQQRNVNLDRRNLRASAVQCEPAKKGDPTTVCRPPL